MKTQLVILSLLLLVGCGFKPQASYQLPPQFQIVNVTAENPYDDFVLALQKNLQQKGVQLSPKAPILINLLQINDSMQQTTLDLSTATRVSTYTLAVTFNITNQQGKILLATRTITTARNITLSPNEIISASKQPKLTKQELNAQTITKLCNILHYENIAP